MRVQPKCPRPVVRRTPHETHHLETPKQSQTHQSQVPRIGLAMSDLLPSAAIVKAVRHVDFTALGKVSNSLSAALTHEIGRVVLVISEPLLVTSWPTRARPCCHN